VAAPLLPEPDRLDRLVTVLDAAFAAGGWHQPHRLVSLEPDPNPPQGAGAPGGVAFGFRTLEEGQHPLDLLVGMVAPRAWSGIGAVCFGWAAPGVDVDPARLTIPGRRPSRHPLRCRVRVTTLVDRSGTERSTASLDDGTVVDDPGRGTITDALRRTLRLPTDPAPVRSSELFAALWLESVAGAGGPLPWAEVARRHPALQVREAAGDQPRPEELVGSGRALHRVMDWEQLRQRAASGRRDGGIAVDAEVAAWMDDGMFARWVLSSRAPLPELLRACADHLSPGVLRRVRRALRAWDIDPPLVGQVA